MQNNLIKLALVSIVVMISACANSGDKWANDSAASGSSANSGWQQSQPNANEEKKASNSYWKEESRY